MNNPESTLFTNSPGYYDNLELMYELANHFYKPEDIDQLKTGQFGYNNAAMAKSITDNAIIRNVYFQENFLNTASTPGAIITFAKQYDYNIGLAIPSSCRILVGFYLSELKANLDADSRFIINKDNSIFLDGAEFLLPANVNIFITDNNSINVKYDLTNRNLNINIPEFVRTFTASEPNPKNGEVRTIVYCELNIFQIRRNTSNFKVLSTNVMDNTRFEVNIPEGQQLAYFTVKYKSTEDAKYIDLPLFFNDENPPEKFDKYCFYSYDGGESGIKNLVIYFSGLINAFRPAYNSELVIEFYTTTGSKGNFNFVGKPVLTVTNQQNQPLFFTSQMITTPSAGKDRESLKEIKQGCLRKFLYRESIVIEADLEMFLNNTVEKEKVNNSTVEFVKRRDDVLSRLFGGFLLLKDANDNVIPTNTANLSIDYTKLVERNWVLKPGDLVIYDRQLDIYRLIEDHEYPTNYINDPNSFIYCIPFYIKVSKSPVLFASYIKNNINAVVPLTTYKTYDSLISAESFIVNNLEVTRNSIFDDYYLIKCNISTNLNETALSSRVIPRLSFKNKNDLVIGSIDLYYDKDNNFVGTLKTSDKYNDQIEILIENSLVNINNISLPEVALPEDLYIEMEIYFNSTGNMGTQVDNVKNIEKDEKYYQLIQAHRNDNNPINLFKKLDFSMFSKISVNTSGVFNITDIPLVGASFFLNTQKHAEIDNIISNFQIALDSAFSLLQNNTSIDIKFFNTYGVSKYYSTDRTNMSVHLGVKVDTPSEDIRSKIINEIVNYVNESYSKLDTAINLSNIITHLENTFSEIRYMRYYTINGVETQSITVSSSKQFLEQDNSRIPELINISTKLDDQGHYTPDIRLDFI